MPQTSQTSPASEDPLCQEASSKGRQAGKPLRQRCKSCYQQERGSASGAPQIDRFRAINLVQLALDRQKALACEDLTGIRGRGNGFNRAMRTELNSWAFHQLKLFLAYKCQRAGVTLIEVDPRFSSQTCSGCGHCERGNRKSQEWFECLCCGLRLNADVNAALNLKAWGELSAALMFRLEAIASN
jgi:putative transposase